MRAAAFLVVLAILTAIQGPGVDAAGTRTATFFVAPGGDDGDPGSEEKPFETLARARDAVREAIQEGRKGDVTVLLRGGVYRMTEPAVFGPSDGGSEEESVTYAAYPGEQPVVSGGRVITGWKTNDDGTWSTEISEVRAGKWAFRELFVDGRRAPRARHPNEGWLRVEKVGEDRRTSFQFKAGDLHVYRDLDQVEMVFLHDWSITRTPVKSIDPNTRTLTVPNQIGGPTRWGVMDWFEKQPRYFLEGSTEMLDTPGEWCLNSKTGVLRYRPRPGEEMYETEFIAPVARQILVVRGHSDPYRPVRNLHFVGLDVRHAAWAPPGGVYWGRQACTYWTPGTAEAGRSHEEADPAAVQFELAESCSFRDGSVTRVGASGVWLARGCRDCRVAGSVVSDTGGNGIMIGEGQVRNVGEGAWWEVAPEQAAAENRVTNCLVQRCGQELSGAVGIWIGLAGDTTVRRNEIRNVPYTGVSVGWMWWNPRSRPEPRKTPCRNNVVAENHIHHVMQTLSDGGGIYVLGEQPGSALRGNLIHDVPVNAGRAESNGMFLDQGTGHFVIEENVIYNVDRSPLRFHKGWENLVRNNVLEVGEGIPLVRYNDTKTERIKLEENTVVKSEAELREAVEAARRRTGPEPEYREKFKAM